ncbi:MAG TPA: hypothetical protein VMB27_17765 [Solirubrobacteraceae bacterium]|nr:hypothetical protein [Solirubrobacteraceae bacterium]
MPVGVPRAARFALSLAVAFVASGAMASAAFAWSYTAVVTPGTVASQSSTTFNVALTNTSGGNPLGSAIIRPPGKFTLTSASLGGAQGNLELDPKRVVLTGLKLPPGGSVNVSVTATAPSKCKTFNWHTKAFSKGLNSQPLDYDGGSLTTTVTCSTTGDGLEFGVQPSDTMVNDDVTPPVTVQLVDASDSPVAQSGVPVTLALGNDPGLGTLSGTLTEPTDASGVATFSDLSIDQPGVGYTLTASSTGLTSATSDPFNETNTTTTACNPNNVSCFTDLGTSVSDLEVSADPAAGSITESVDVGSPLICPNQRISFDSNFYLFSETGTVEKFLSYELFGLNSDQIDEVSICFGATYEFVNANGGEAASGTLPNGSPGFVDLLPNCDDDFEGIGPCVDGITTFTDDHSGLVVHVDVPFQLNADGSPGDPMIHG